VTAITYVELTQHYVQSILLVQQLSTERIHDAHLSTIVFT